MQTRVVNELPTEIADRAEIEQIVRRAFERLDGGPWTITLAPADSGIWHADRPRVRVVISRPGAVASAILPDLDALRGPGDLTLLLPVPSPPAKRS